MDSTQRTDTVVPNLVLRNIGLHMNVQTVGPGASKGFLPAVWSGGVYMFGEQLVAQDGTTR